MMNAKNVAGAMLLAGLLMPAVASAAEESKDITIQLTASVPGLLDMTAPDGTSLDGVARTLAFDAKAGVLEMQTIPVIINSNTGQRVSLLLQQPVEMKKSGEEAAIAMTVTFDGKPLTAGAPMPVNQEDLERATDLVIKQADTNSRPDAGVYAGQVSLRLTETTDEAEG